MSVEEFLDLTGIDVFTTANDHILDTPDDIDITLFIHRRQVASMHPACCIDGSSCRLWIIPVAEHDTIASRTELAGCPNWYDLSCGRVNNLDLNIRMHSANSAHTLL